VRAVTTTHSFRVPLHGRDAQYRTTAYRQSDYRGIPLIRRYLCPFHGVHHRISEAWGAPGVPEGLPKGQRAIGDKRRAFYYLELAVDWHELMS